MAKCFFILKNRSDVFEASLGLAYFDAQSVETAVDQARRIAGQLRRHRPYRTCSIVVMEQGGKEIGRVPVAPRAERTVGMPIVQSHKLVS